MNEEMEYEAIAMDEMTIHKEITKLINIQEANIKKFKNLLNIFNMAKMDPEFLMAIYGFILSVAESQTDLINILEGKEDAEPTNLAYADPQLDDQPEYMSQLNSIIYTLGAVAKSLSEGGMENQHHVKMVNEAIGKLAEVYNDRLEPGKAVDFGNIS